MKIAKDSKIGVALAVLKAIPMKAKDVNVRTYSNCREQGFFLVSYHKSQPCLNRRAVSFAENRNSDDIIVQYAIENDFNEYGVISEGLYYKAKRHFNVGEFEEAGKFVAQWLSGETI